MLQTHTVVVQYICKFHGDSHTVTNFITHVYDDAVG